MITSFSVWLCWASVLRFFLSQRQCRNEFGGKLILWYCLGNATMRLVGQILSMDIAMLVFAWMIGNRSLTHENGALLIGSAKLTFGILAVTCVFGVFASLARGRVHNGMGK